MNLAKFETQFTFFQWNLFSDVINLTDSISIKLITQSKIKFTAKTLKRNGDKEHGCDKKQKPYDDINLTGLTDYRPRPYRPCTFQSK